jgi:hypothetical protein
MSQNMMIGYDIYDRVTMEHFRLRQSMILTTSFFCSRQYLVHLREEISRVRTSSPAACRNKVLTREILLPAYVR